MPSPAIVELRHLGKIYPPNVAAIDDVSFSVAAGEIRGLVGMNGAGKSTIIKILSGVERPSTGSILIDSRPVDVQVPSDADAAGIGVVHQELPLLGNLTAADNVALGAAEGSLLSRARRRDHERRYDEVAARLPGAPPARSVLDDLDIDAWQMVALVRALSAGAKVLVLDEPTSSLNATERNSLHRSIRGLADQGVAIIYVSHFLDDVLETCDSVTVMRDGHVVADRPIDDLDQRQLLRLMTGEDLAADAATHLGEVETVSEVRLAVNGLVVADAGPVDFVVGRGELVGLYGLRGCGATEVVESVVGLRRSSAGHVAWDGTLLAGPPRTRMERGASFISGNRSKTLLRDWTVADNHELPSLRSHSTFARTTRRTAREAAQRSVDSFAVVGDVDRPIGTLSGGNQQKISVGRALDGELIVADEPTRGVDAKARLTIHQALRSAADRGASLLVHSTESEELVSLCHRVLVMDSGRIVDELAGRALTVDSLESATALATTVRAATTAPSTEGSR